MITLSSYILSIQCKWTQQIDFIIKINIKFIKYGIMMQIPQNAGISPELIEQTLENQNRYNSVSQIAYYACLDKIEQSSIFTKSTCDVECNIIFCYHAEKFEENNKNEIMYYIIRTLNEEIPKLKNKYSIAYVHDSLRNFLFFRGVVKLLPAKFLVKMKDFYIVDGGASVKLAQFFSCGELNAFIKSKTRHLGRVKELEKLNKATLGGDLVTNLKIKMTEQTPISTHELDESDAKLIRSKLYGKQLSEYPLSSSGIPIYIESLIMRLYSNPSFLQAEGLMRKSCDVEQLQLLEQAIINGQNWDHYVRKLDNPYVICGCIKKIFNNLNSPLFSFQIYDLIKAFRSDSQFENDIAFFRSCLAKMKKLHKQVLVYTLAFLKRGIIAYVEQNKMPAYNLSVVFGPCFFRPKQYKLEDLMASGKFSFTIKFLLQNFQEVIGQQNAYNLYNLLDQQKMDYLTR